mgnify:CR=1 FL=1
MMPNFIGSLDRKYCVKLIDFGISLLLLKENGVNKLYTLVFVTVSAYI